VSNGVGIRERIHVGVVEIQAKASKEVVRRGSAATLCVVHDRALRFRLDVLFIHTKEGQEVGLSAHVIILSFHVTGRVE
jgi:hypothetical protein